jgi:hypothetical protein
LRQVTFTNVERPGAMARPRGAGERQVRTVLLRQVAFSVLAVALAACTTSVSPSPSPTDRTFPDLGIQNGTTIPVTLLVNGAVLETVAPGDYQDPVTLPMPSLPWRIEARSPAGRVLTSLTVTTTTYVDWSTGVGARVDLSCGRLDLWSGPPMLGPAPGSGSPGDCN